LETSIKYSYLHKEYTEAAKFYTKNNLQIITSVNPFGSDHMSFINLNMPGILIIDGDWGVYPNYHRITDTIDKINVPLAMDILRMNVALLSSYIYSFGITESNTIYSTTYETSTKETHQVEPEVSKESVNSIDSIVPTILLLIIVGGILLFAIKNLQKWRFSFGHIYKRQEQEEDETL